MPSDDAKVNRGLSVLMATIVVTVAACSGSNGDASIVATTDIAEPSAADPVEIEPEAMHAAEPETK